MPLLRRRARGVGLGARHRELPLRRRAVAFGALQRRGALHPGETVLVLGSAGGVGTAAVQIAKAMGANVIAMVHRPGAVDFVESLGADAVLPLTDGWRDAVLAHTGGRGVDMGVDPVGGPAFDDAIRVLATEGRLLVIGFAAGGIPTVKVNRLLLRNVGVLGVGWGEFVNRTPGAQAEVGAALGALGYARAHTGSARAFIFAPGTAPAIGADILSAAGLSDVFTFDTGGAP